MPKRLAKRTSAEPPKERKEPEQDSYLCKGAETVAKPEDRVPTLGYCTKCKVLPANSEVDRLCYGCHKESAGFELDTNKNRYVKVKGRKVK